MKQTRKAEPESILLGRLRRIEMNPDRVRFGTHTLAVRRLRMHINAQPIQTEVQCEETLRKFRAEFVSKCVIVKNKNGKQTFKSIAKKVIS